MTLKSGSVLGRYRLEKLLGTGGMASVWKARDERLDRIVAVKILSETLALDRDYVKRFNREAQTAARLSHPNLVAVFDFNVEEDRPYLVSEYIEGGTLADRIDAGAPVEANSLARQLLSAVDHIHSAGVIHRDIKPANLLIDTDGRSRLTDFGIAQPTGATAITETGKVVGTLAYMAPEVRSGDPATKRSDLYSCGVVLGECLGERGDSELSALIERLTATDPKARPRSAAAALKRLEDLPEAQTLAVTQPLPPTGPTRRMTRTAGAALAGRRRTVAALVVLLAVALAGFVFAQSLGGGDDPAELADTQPKPTTAAAAEQPAPTPPTTTAAASTCAELEQRKKQLKEEKKAAEESAGEDEEAKKALEEEVKAREEALTQQIDAACQEGGESDDGRGPDGEGPPGQLKKGEGGND